MKSLKTGKNGRLLREAGHRLFSAQRFWVNDGGRLLGPVSWADLSRSVKEQVKKVGTGNREIILVYRGGSLVGIRPVR